MSSIPIDHSADLLRLRTEGYDVFVNKASYLLVPVPYVNANRDIRSGTLVCALDLAGDITTRPEKHLMRFVGEYPCDSAGSPLMELHHNSADEDLGAGLIVNHSFSRMPSRGYYVDFYEKVTHYANLISGHAKLINPNATAQTRLVAEPEEGESPFNYLDSASARADVGAVTEKLVCDAVAIVGLGGTGSYVFDKVAKTPVKAVHIFDADRMLTHNAFRAPGAPTIEVLRTQPLKVDYYKDMYSRMHRGIVAHPVKLDASNVELLRRMSFVFLCMDSGAAKKAILEKLEEYGIPFIDVAMGLYLKNGALGGLLNTALSTPGHRDSARQRISLEEDSEENEYDKNIQIAELNALNACLAVIRWKKTRGFYLDTAREQFSCYKISSNSVFPEDPL